jgi:hypothetical protein
LLGLAVITLIGVGIRLIVTQTVQQRRERENRQINERLRTLIAAYKNLGGSFTGDLAVDPAHLRELQLRAAGRGRRGIRSRERTHELRSFPPHPPCRRGPAVRRHPARHGADTAALTNYVVGASARSEKSRAERGRLCSSPSTTTGRCETISCSLYPEQAQMISRSPTVPSRAAAPFSEIENDGMQATAIRRFRFIHPLLPTSPTAS